MWFAIVYKNEKLVFVIYPVLLPGFQSFENDKKTNIVNFVLSFN